MAKRTLYFFVFLFAVSTAWAQPFDSRFTRETREPLAQDKPAPVEYTLSFPAPEHRWMQVEVRFPSVPSGTLQVRMARTSPGRYALHEFAKNVFDVLAVNGKGQPLIATRPDPHQWDFAAHDGTVVITYKVYGDRTDGTYLGIDDIHAHINIPAALMFARGWFERPARVTFVPPPGKPWRVATQLFPTSDPLVYTAPNIHYLMDSPTDFSNFMLRTFTVDDGQKRNGPPPTFRIALTHDGTEAEADAFAKDVERIVREAIPVFGELPNFDGNTYTFLSVYLPWANFDGMEHRNSTSLTNSGALRNPQDRSGILGTVAHEFFHAWNMERLRSAGIEPFDFEDADMSDDLWLGEGFTNHFASLIQHRAGFTNLDGFVAELAGVINAVQLSPGRIFRSGVDMSRLAPFVDNATSIDRTAWPNLFISYYTYGQAIGLGLDLSLRDRSNGKVTGDAYMNALWAQFGRPGQKEPGKVSTPYTIDGLKESLAKVSGDRGFANDFFGEVRRGPRRRRLRAAARPRRPGGAQAQRRPSIRRPGAVRQRRQRAARAGPGAVGIGALQGRRRAGRSVDQHRWLRADIVVAATTKCSAATSRAIACRCDSSAVAARSSTRRWCSKRIRASRSCRWKRSAACSPTIRRGSGNRG